MSVKSRLAQLERKLATQGTPGVRVITSFADLSKWIHDCEKENREIPAEYGPGVRGSFAALVENTETIES